MNRQRIHLMYQSSADWLSLFKRQTDLKFISICATFIYRRYDGSETSSTVRLKPIRQVEIWLWIANWSEEIILRGSFDHMQVLTTNQLSFLFHLHEPQSFINPPLHTWPSWHKKKKKKKRMYIWSTSEFLAPYCTMCRNDWWENVNFCVYVYFTQRPGKTLLKQFEKTC